VSEDLDFSKLVEEEETDNSDLVDEVERFPLIGDSDWQDYVLNSLHEGEFILNKEGQRLPKVNGLRRVVNKLLGPIIKSGPIQVSESKHSGFYVIYEVHISWTHGLYNKNVNLKEDIERLIVKEFKEVADAGPHNTPAAFLNYLPATASSRAEGRALRKALQLNIVTAEEVSANNIENSDDLFAETSPIEWSTKSQEVTIGNGCRKIGVDMDKFLHMYGYDSFKMKKEEATVLIGKLNEWQNDTNAIPKEILR
jgi:hypothetical protein